MGIVARVGPDELQPWKALANFVENQRRAVTILHAGGDTYDRYTYEIKILGPVRRNFRSASP